MPAFYGEGNGEIPVGDWTEPNLMTAFAGPNKPAFGLPKQPGQFSIEISHRT